VKRTRQVEPRDDRVLGMVHEGASEHGDRRTESGPRNRLDSWCGGGDDPVHLGGR